MAISLICLNANTTVINTYSDLSNEEKSIFDKKINDKHDIIHKILNIKEDKQPTKFILINDYYTISKNMIN